LSDMAKMPKMRYFFVWKQGFFNNFLPIDRSLIDNDFRNFDVNNLEIILTF
jgi:hypothetical protein